MDALLALCLYFQRTAFEDGYVVLIFLDLAFVPINLLQ